ncbi:oligosaccharide flippase family protein [Thermaurantiacus sp.]
MNEEPPKPAGARRRLGGRVAKGAGLLWLLAISLRGVGFLTTLVLARLLVPEDFGIVALASAVVGVIDILFNVQTSLAIIREREPAKSHFDTAFALNLLRSAATAAALALAAYPVAAFMEEPRLAPVLLALILPAVAAGLTNPYFILYARNLNFRLETQRRLTAAALGSASALLIGFLFRTHWALVASLIVNGVAMALLSYWRVPGRPGLSLVHWRSMFGFGGWLVVYRILQYAGNRFDYFFIGRVLDTATVGAYSVSGQFNRAASGDVVPSLSKALFPAFSQMTDDPERMRQAYLKVQGVAMATALPVGVGMGLLAEPLILLALGPQWGLAITITQVLAPILSLQALAAGSEGVAMALGRTRTLALRSLVFVTSRTALIVAGFAAAGFPGLLAGRALASGLVFPAYNLYLGSRLVGGRLLDPLRASWRSFAAAGVMTAALLLLPDPAYAGMNPLALAGHLAGRAGLGTLLYIATHGLLWRLSGRPAGSAEPILFDYAERLLEQLRTRLRPS